MIKFYNITESELNSKQFESESLYYCYDTLNIYLDSPVDNKRLRMSTDTIVLATETDRNNILAPLPYKIYCVLSTGSLYIYTNGGWNRLGGSQFIIKNVLVENGTVTLKDDRITDIDKAVFYPDLSVVDLATNVTATCSKGTVTVTLTSNYPILGTVMIN